MKANSRVHPSLPASFRPASLRLPAPARVALLALAIGAGLSACSEQRAIPRPTASVSPRPAAPATAQSAPSRPAPSQPSPGQPAPAPVNWIDLPAAPGNWTWRPIPGGSQADFAGGQFTIRCDVVARTVTLQRAGRAAGAPAMTILTTQGSRTVPAMGLERRTGDAVLEATLSARDPLLDAMAFSRGRFAVSSPGLPLLSVPNWAEVGRVIEDCR